MNEETLRTDQEGAPESNPSDKSISWQTPSNGRRTLAKFVDLVALGFIIYGFSTLLGSYLLGLICGFAWLSISDWETVSTGKSWCKLQVVQISGDRVTPCSAWASFLRNLPIILVLLPHRLHAALLGLSPDAYRETYPQFTLNMTLLGLAWLVWALFAITRNPDARHFGDQLAGTRVVAAQPRM